MRSLLADRLQARAPEIHRAILDRLDGMPDTPSVRDAEYLQGLRQAVTRGVEYGIELIALGEQSAPTAPLPLLTQARLAARQGMSLDVVLRRYLAGKMLLTDFLLEEIERTNDGNPALLREALAVFETAFDRVLCSVTDEYARELRAATSSSDSWLGRKIQRLLEGEVIDPSFLDYNLRGQHIALVALAPEVRPILRKVGRDLGGRVLTVAMTNEQVWTWIGTTEPLDSHEVLNAAKSQWPDSVPLAIGEPAAGTSGWRRTHAQAKAAAGIAARSTVPVRYKDVALVASLSCDPLFLASVQKLILDPLNSTGRQAEALRRTLLVYFETKRNRSSTSSALRVSRPTVASRLNTVEELLGLSLDKDGDLIHTALRLEAQGCFATP